MYVIQNDVLVIFDDFDMTLETEGWGRGHVSNPEIGNI